jgi:hypothetical protein
MIKNQAKDKAKPKQKDKPKTKDKDSTKSNIIFLPFSNVGSSPLLVRRGHNHHWL